MIGCGVDPGVDGGLVVGEILTDSGSPFSIRPIDHFIMPTLKESSGKGNQRAVNSRLVFDWLAMHKPDVAYIERIFMMKGKTSGVIHAGKNYGLLIAPFLMMRIPYAYVTSTSWQNFIFRPESGAKRNKYKKEHGLAFCQSKGFDVPLRTPRSKKLHDGVSDAWCILWASALSGRANIVGGG